MVPGSTTMVKLMHRERGVGGWAVLYTLAQIINHGPFSGKALQPLKNKDQEVLHMRKRKLSADF